jgi:hypothetical protein
VTAEVQRDRWGRPLILLPDGSDRVAYRRASSFGGPLEDLNNLIMWKQRMVAQAIAEHPRLQLKVAAANGDKRKLNELCEEAMDVAGANVKSDIGTSLHGLTEALDRGEDIGFVPPAYQADLDAYERVTRKAGFRWLTIEEFMVQDALRAAGTPDRIAEWQGENYVVDLKTGSIDWPHKFAVQLGIYANSKVYDPATDKRSDPPPVNKDRAILIHLPAGTGTCRLHWLNIRRGIWAAELSQQVTEWRNTTDLTREILLEDAA